MKVPMGPPPPRQPKLSATTDLVTLSGDSSANISEMNTGIEGIDGLPATGANGCVQKDGLTAQGSLENSGLQDSGGISEDKPGVDSQSLSVETKERTETGSSSHPYSIPPWSEPPGLPYNLEVLKDGIIIENLIVSEKGAYMFGRSDQCDFVLEHPTISRYHAVLQYKANGDAFIYDLGSTHGSFVNKNQVKPKAYKQLHVGDVLRFGHSSRLYILQGPMELMPPERPVKGGRNLIETNVLEEEADMEASLLRAKREASLADGISWGMMEDAFEEYTKEDENEITWQTYTGQLTEKQEKTRDKVLKRNEKIANLRKEIDAIQAKEIAQGGLTQGQQTQIARNEQRIEQIVEELDNLEETLNQSIQESIGARVGQGCFAKGKGAAEDDDGGQSDDDEFYDRTKKRMSSGQKKAEEQQVETAETLLEKKENLAKDMEDIRATLHAEESNNQTHNAGGNLESEDPLDAFMTGLSSEIVKGQATQLRRELERLQSELDRVVYLLKIADPTGEASRKRESQLHPSISTQTGESLSVLVGSSVKKSIPPDQKIPTKLQKASTITGKTSLKEKTFLPTAMVDDRLLEHEKGKSGGSDNGNVGMRPRWLGATHNREDEKVQGHGEISHPESVSNSSEFVDYKDRKQALLTSSNEEKASASALEDASGLVLRTPKQMDQKSDSTRENREDDKLQDGLTTTGTHDAEASVADAVALLLRHKRGFAASDEQHYGEKQDSTGSNVQEAQKKKNRKLGPEKPAFLSEGGSDYDSWLPPKGQTGDGRTSLNDKYGY